MKALRNLLVRDFVVLLRNRFPVAIGAVWAASTAATLSARFLALELVVLIGAVFAVFEATTLGFVFASVTVFQEKEEGALRAYRLSPGGLSRWLAAKLLLWTAFPVVYGATYLAASGWLAIDWFGAVAALAAGSLFMSSLGIAVAAPFRDISSWFMPGVTALLANMVPLMVGPEAGLAGAVAAASPSGALLSAFRATLAAGVPVPPAASATSLAWCVAAIPLAALSARVFLFKEGRK